MPKENKITAVELSNRLAIVGDMLLSGLQRKDILRAVLTSKEDKGLGWDVTENMIDRYIARCSNMFKELSKRRREDSFADHLAKRDFIYRRCIKKSDERTALAALRDKAELERLYEPDNEVPESVEIIEGQNLRVTKIYRLADKLRNHHRVEYTDRN